jgi:hypothetical protein
VTTAQPLLPAKSSYQLNDAVLYCDTTNGSAHAPTVVSLAPSTGSVLVSSLGSLQMVRFLVLRHRVVHSLSERYKQPPRVVRFINYALRHDLLPLHFDLIDSGGQFK